MKFLELFQKVSGEAPLSIYDFVYAILNQAILLPISADTQDAALTIFSTLNDRGLPLSDADIFKANIYNHLKTEEKILLLEIGKILMKKQLWFQKVFSNYFITICFI